MLDPEFPQLVANVLAATGLEPRWLTLEITESSAVQNLDQTVFQVAQLRAMGVDVAMDNFGTGFSSLNMLRRLRLNTVKIDKGLIDPLPEHDAIAVVRAICLRRRPCICTWWPKGWNRANRRMPRAMPVVANCQGFLFSKPLLAPDAGLWLARSVGVQDG